MRTKHIVPTEAYDPISGLADDICGRIVSFLPMKEAVATSVLSKRWRYAWTFSPVLDLDLSLFPKARGRRAAFADFADSAVALFALPHLTKLRLSLDDARGGGGGPDPRLESWLAFAVARRVQDLELCLPRSRTRRLPDSIFRCGSITSLKLRLRCYAFELPSPAGLPRLRVLHLTSISLSKGSFFQDLFSNCVLLEELVVEECRTDVLEIDGARKLTTLVISKCSWVDPARIRVSAPRLKTLHYVGGAADEHCMENLQRLDEVVLGLRAPSLMWEAEEDCQERLVKLFQMVGGARSLTLSSWCIRHLARAPGLPDGVQEGVKHLVLFMERREDGLGAIAPLLRSCPYLETLSVSVTPSQSVRKGRATAREKQRELGIRRMARQLKTARLENIDESKTGLELVRFLLKNLRALEKMTIVPSKDGLEHAKFRRKVSTFPRASRNVVIEYHFSE
ncbi:F-box/LRR-repeat protein At4g14103-like [Phoenix dactylifera]|uniref:F-box/LRR-repeat protein At4g14103-like n=1 Tax=Phoenix dactylifera TaxID=42345 RepID=A0A8B7MVG3_PHODC|nr:F-box/LRR-repeat protein At4g14103-like [Phoenix dactylifera]